MLKGIVPAAFLALGLAIAAPAQAENLRGDTLIVRALDKVTAKTEDFKIKIGETLRFGSLDVQAVHCEKRPPEETPETFAFLKIHDRLPPKVTTAAKSSQKETAKGGQTEPHAGRVFSGWMFASSPALSALQHPVYDVWVLDCAGLQDVPPQ